MAKRNEAKKSLEAFKAIVVDKFKVEYKIPRWISRDMFIE